MNLNLENNNLTGTIPDIFDSLTGLQDVVLGGNQFNGTIPQSFGAMESLLSLSLGFNHLTGPLTDLSNDMYLWDLQLNDNSLSGTIPKGICQKHLQFVNEAHKTPSAKQSQIKPLI